MREERFAFGTKDGGKTFVVFEWEDEYTYLFCSAPDEESARFITASLNHCQDFWQPSEDLYLARLNSAEKLISNNN